MSVTHSTGPARSWVLVVPVKPPAVGKSRLAPDTGALRPDLALAFAVDTVTAALACPRVLGVLVVTADPGVSARVRALGASVTGDPGTGLNGALAHGARVAARHRPGVSVAALSADLPALRPAELDAVLAEAARHQRAFLADAAGIGTTMLTAAPGVLLAPRFEGPSRRAHLLSGAREIALCGVETVRRDVDTSTDLREAVRLGVGPCTAGLVPLLPAVC